LVHFKPLSLQLPKETEKSKGSSFNSVTTNLKNNVNNESIMTMTPQLKLNACHIHLDVKKK